MNLNPNSHRGAKPNANVNAAGQGDLHRNRPQAPGKLKHYLTAVIILLLLWEAPWTRRPRWAS